MKKKDQNPNKGRRHNDQTKRAALADLQTLGVSQTSRKYGVSSHSIYAWRKKFGSPKLASPATSPITALRSICEVLAPFPQDEQQRILSAVQMILGG